MDEEDTSAPLGMQWLDWGEVTIQISSKGKFTVVCFEKDRDDAIAFVASSLVGEKGRIPRMAKSSEQIGEAHKTAAVERIKKPATSPTENVENVNYGLQKVGKLAGTYIEKQEVHPSPRLSEREDVFRVQTNPQHVPQTHEGSIAKWTMLAVTTCVHCGHVNSMFSGGTCARCGLRILDS